MALAIVVAHGAPKRSRSEAVPGMHASNTANLGDIWVQAAANGQFRVTPIPEDWLVGLADSAYRNDLLATYGGGQKLRRDVLLAPALKVTIGLADILHLEVENIPWDGEKIGASRAGLTLTTPGNDDLRVFGLAVMADATLSTEEDIYSRGVTTPGFDPLFHLGIAADMDLIKWAPSLPLKVYLNWSDLADYRLAHAFKQQWGAAAVEWKGYRREYYGRLGLKWLKPLPTRFDPDPKQSWRGPNSELGLGMRWFFGDRFWGNAEISFDPLQPLEFYSDATHYPPKVFVGIEIPVLYQESRAEALRALVYNEELRKTARQNAQAGQAARPDSSEGFSQTGTPVLPPLGLDQLDLRSHGGDSASTALKTLFEDQEDVSVQKRKRIRQELQHIEELLP